MTTEKLKNIEAIVKSILEVSKKAQNDDFYLYAVIVEMYCPNVKHERFTDVLKNHNEYGMPSYESVSRARRKVQEKCPHLASERVKEKRAKEQKVYEEYALYG